MAAYKVPPSPDYIPGPEVPPSPDYIPGPEGPPSLDYVPGPEEPEQAPPSPVYLPYVPEPVYPEYIPPEDDVFLAEEQPLHAATSPTAVTNAQIQAMINEGVTAALAARDATRNGDDSHTSGTGARRPVQVARECTYPDFLKCQPLNFKGTEGVVGLTQWFEKMESVYSISNCTVACQVKFATCTLKGRNAPYTGGTPMLRPLLLKCPAMPWRTLKKIMTDKNTAQGAKLRNWSSNVEFEADTIHGSVMATKPKTMQDAIEFATELMDKKINTWAERQADNKRKSDDTARNNQNQQPNKRQNTGRAYAAGNGDRKPYGGPKPLCSKCNYHHEGPWTQGHFKKGLAQNCKNNNNRVISRGNQAGNAKAQAKVYAVGNAGANPDNNVITGTFLLNNRYASILFDTGADRSFVSTAFSSRIVITPTALDHDYNVELADGRIVGLNTIIRGCTLNLLNHPFNIDLMPVELGSFDVIIGMDWLAKYHAVIVCAEKIVRIPFGDEILIVRGMSRYILSKYTAIQRRRQVQRKKRLEESLCDQLLTKISLEVFPEELPGIPPTRQVEFRIDLVPGATPVARAPYRLAPYELGEVVVRLKNLDGISVRETSVRCSLIIKLSPREANVVAGMLGAGKEGEPPLEFGSLSHDYWLGYSKTNP
ncbi:putative reverse transcriptase domain-containing protein [Tanacetum coccineum]